MRLRLFIAFALITIITLVVLGFVIRGQTQTTLNAFAKSGGFFGADRIILELQGYYLENDSWEGFSLADFQSGKMSDPNLAQNPPGQGRGNVHKNNMYMGGQGMVGDFTLIDVDGSLIASNNPEVQTPVSSEIIDYSIPIYAEGNVVGYLVPDNNIRSLGDVISRNLSRAINNSILPTVIISGGVALVLALLLAYLLMSPVRNLTTAAEKLAQGDLTQRVPLQGGAELEQLAKSFNHMAESLEKSNLSRMSMTADIAHELRTPLAVQKANLEAIQDGVYSLSLENLEPIIQQNIHLNQLVEDLRTLTLTDTDSLVLEKTTTDLVSFLSNICENIQPQFSANKIRIEFITISPCRPLEIDQNRMRQVLYNLLQNSLQHTPTGGIVTITLHCHPQSVSIEVRDNGVGIPQDAFLHIFERFYRADQSRTRQKGGTGLGLSIAQRLVQAHFGNLTAANHPDGGAVFTIILPRD